MMVTKTLHLTDLLKTWTCIPHQQKGCHELLFTLNTIVIYQSIVNDTYLHDFFSFRNSCIKRYYSEILDEV